MRLKRILLAALLISTLSVFFIGSSISLDVKQSLRGPRVDKLHIVVYGDPYKEYAALEAGEIDITDWPLTKTWIDKFAANPDITLLSYSEIGVFEYDINNQKWPTGCDGAAPHEPMWKKGLMPPPPPEAGEPPTPGADWDPETGTWKVYFDPDCPHCQSAWGFRLALAFLTDRDYIQTEILKGYGNMMYTWVPVPALAGYLDWDNLTSTSFVYHGPNGDVTIPSLIFHRDVDLAKQILDAAGFTVNPETGIRIDPRTGKDLEPLIFYIRLDDPNRRAAGEKLAADMMSIGIPVDARVVEKTVCFKSVMVEYNYHLYTGGYSLGADADYLHGLFDSSQYWAPIGWSGGYQGFCNLEHDKYTTDYIKNGATWEEVLMGTHNATFLQNKYVCSIPLWCSVGVQAYRTGWQGVVNHEGYGPSAPITGGCIIWSFLNMYYPDHPTHPGELWWGFKSNLEGPSVITAEWVWDWQVLDLIYDSLITRNPYNLALEAPYMAISWETGEWTYNGKPASWVKFTLRDNLYWHDGTEVTPEDVKFSLEFTRDCGPGVAWNYAGVRDLHHVDTKAEDPTLGDRDVKVYFTVKSYWALHWAGFLPILNKKVWMAASEAIGFGYTPPTVPGEPGTFVDRMKVREYHPWEQDVYNAETGGVGSDGIVDLRQDGCGEFIFVDANLMEWVDLEANRNWYMTQEEVANFLTEAFRMIGDVNLDRVIDIQDISTIARALGTDNTWPQGTGWGEFNPNTDLNGDGRVDAKDLGIAGKNYGKVAG